MSRKNVYTIRGKLHWAKILGDPVDNYSKDGKEWTMDVTPDEDGMKVIEDLGLTTKIKNKEDDRGNFIQFRQKEKRRDGSLNRRISVVNVNDRPWPDDRLLGNGTVAEVKFEFKDYGEGKHPGVYPQAVRVLDYKPYERVEFAPLDKSDPYYKSKEGQLPEDMEPETPKGGDKERDASAVKDALDDDFPE